MTDSCWVLVISSFIRDVGLKQCHSSNSVVLHIFHVSSTCCFCLWNLSFYESSSNYSNLVPTISCWYPARYYGCYHSMLINWWKWRSREGKLDDAEVKKKDTCKREGLSWIRGNGSIGRFGLSKELGKGIHCSRREGRVYEQNYRLGW